ncbi:coactosin-like protein [Xenia sp. Carnegie-2017]|uniref:coactosin-like protein n=1 Tax=Xenia sp. Carnegie-2017 TaxID=2897299 RepID=UPI001F049082|nr:coactosin-like protein [Xenia sp. Carnegie-2017]XP_046842625.1 coactosin-like protein [Xenia sp. Carnegie-2017]
MTISVSRTFVILVSTMTIFFNFVQIQGSSMNPIIDFDAIRAAYEDVRNDDSPTVWAAFKYEGKRIVYAGHGNNYDGFLRFCTDDARIYAYVRVETGDEMSRRAKFAFITWIGPGVSPLKKAKVSTDKAFVKEACPNYDKEILADERPEIAQRKVKAALELAGK